MVNKLTKSRLKNLIVYDFWKMIALSVIVCIVLVLIFNGVAKKPSKGQDFRWVIDDEIFVDNGEIDGVFTDLFNRGAENGGFSYEILKGETVILRSNDESPKNYVLNGVYAELGQDDALILAEETYHLYVNAFNAVSIPKFLDDALDYYATFCDESGNLIEQKVYDNFSKTRGKDSRFRKQSEFEEGKKQELLRIKGIKANATALKNCFEKHPELLDEVRTIENTTISGNFALRLDKFTSKGEGENKKDIQNLFKRAVVSESGETTYTTQGVYFVIGENSAENGDLFYENLAVLYTIINIYTDYLS